MEINITAMQKYLPSFSISQKKHIEITADSELTTGWASDVMCLSKINPWEKA
jgi:hypothetical protein